ncbi:MAG: PaaI family thioesterase [Anaerolineales bacterium]|jgi:acyl-coenzyme A thioesterase PaaI-like protein
MTTPSHKKLPNSYYCFACGLENDFGLKLAFYQEGNDTIVVDYVVPDHYQGYPGVVHGGIVTTMLDEVLGRVIMIDDPNRLMFTAKLTTRYRKPVPTETPLKLIGKVVKDRGRIAEAKAELLGPDGTLLAEAEGLMVSLSQDVLDNLDKEALGWQVYPDEEEST